MTYRKLLDARRATGGMGLDEYEREVARIEWEATQPQPIVLPDADPDYVPPEDTTPQDVVIADFEPLPGE